MTISTERKIYKINDAFILLGIVTIIYLFKFTPRKWTDSSPMETITPRGGLVLSEQTKKMWLSPHIYYERRMITDFKVLAKDLAYISLLHILLYLWMRHKGTDELKSIFSKC